MTDTSGAGSLRAQRERLGDLEKYEEPRRTDRAQFAVDKSGALDGTRALISSLGETNPVLRDLLNTAMEEIQGAAITFDTSTVDTATVDTATASSTPTTTASASATSAGSSSGSGYGRRLMQRIEYNTYMTDVLVTHELMEFYGKGSEIEPAYSKPVLTHCPIAFQERVAFLVSRLAHARQIAPFELTHTITH